MCRPPEVRTQLSRPLRRYVCVAKKAAALRSGCELSSGLLDVEIASGWTVDVSESRVTAAGTMRCRIVSYTTRRGETFERDGWVSGKLFSYDGLAGHANPARVPEPEPEAEAAAGEAPFAAVFGAPTGKGNVMLFPGQGAQKVGMLAPYADTPRVKAMFEEASKVFGADLLELVTKGPAETLNDTRFSQVCVFLTSMAAVMKLARDDPKAVDACAVTAGFSLGEYSALTFAGVMGLKTALTLLKLRGEAMGAACDLAPSGMMTVIGLDDDALRGLMPADVSIANQMFPKGRVLSGSKAGIADVEREIKALNLPGVKTIVQPVSGAFHSPFMATAAAKLEEALASADFRPPTRVVYSNVDGRPHGDDVDSIKRKMKDQLTAGVMWQDTIDHMRALDAKAFYEPAPGRQLASMMRRIDPANAAKMKSV